VLFDYLIAATIGFAGMLGVLYLGAEIITLNEQTVQITMAETILRELSVLSHLLGANPSDTLERCASPAGPPFEATCPMVLESLSTLPDHRVQVLTGRVLELSWTPAFGEQLTVRRMPEML
jgi:hypothetical protein